LSWGVRPVRAWVSIVLSAFISCPRLKKQTLFKPAGREKIKKALDNMNSVHYITVLGISFKKYVIKKYL
jgi:hypothetical protein